VDTAGVVQTALSSLTVLGIVSYVGHSIWTDYKEFQDNVYKKLGEMTKLKQDKTDCDDHRQNEKEARERVDRDLQDYKKAVQR